jgi:hypothetical protein
MLIGYHSLAKIKTYQPVEHQLNYEIPIDGFSKLNNTL